MNFQEDNSLVFAKLEEATRGTQYAASIKPFEKTNNGKAAYKAIMKHHVGEDKWSKEITKNNHLLHNLKWKSNGNVTMERFIAQHRHAYQQLLAASEYVTHQLPDSYTRVSYLLQAIQTTDPDLCAAIANIKKDKTDEGMRRDFEAASAYLQESDPVAQRLSGQKRPAGEISMIEAGTGNNNVTVAAFKSGIGKTGVHLRFYAQNEYRKLLSAQKQELKEWRGTPEGKAAVAKSKSDREKRQKVNISSLVEKELTKRLKTIENEKAESVSANASFKDAIVSALQDLAADASTTTTPTPAVLYNYNMNYKPQRRYT